MEQKSTGLRLFNETIKNNKTQEYLHQVLGEKKGSFVTSLTSLVANNKNLQACEPLSLMYAALKATALGLPLDNSLGFAYAIPYKDNRSGTTVAQFQLGAKAFTQLAIRSGEFLTINVTDIREGEYQGKNIMTGELKPFAEVENREEKPVVGYCAYFKLTNGFEKALYWTVEEVTAHAKKYSQAYRNDRYNTSPWHTNFDSMASKTVLKALLSKYAPLYVEKATALADALKADQAVINGNKYNYADNPENNLGAGVAGLAVDDIETAEEVQEEIKDIPETEEVKEKKGKKKADNDLFPDDVKEGGND